MEIRRSSGEKCGKRWVEHGTPARRPDRAGAPRRERHARRVLRAGLQVDRHGRPFGAVQFASGSDLVTAGRAVGSGQQDADLTAANPASQGGINRSAKSDRADGVRSASQPSRTISVNLDHLAATSVLIRLPARLSDEARNRAPAQDAAREPTERKVACDPVVSVLTEVAKHLQPGRCVT